MAQKCCYNKILMNFFGEDKMKTRQDKTMVKFYLFTIIIEFFLGHILKKIKKFGAWSFLLVHIHFRPNEGPKDFVI